MVQWRTAFHPKALLAGALANGLWSLASLGLGFVVAYTAKHFDLPSVAGVVLGIGIALISVPCIAFLRLSHRLPDGASRESRIAKSARWESRPDIVDETILLVLASLKGAQMIHGFACDVRSPTDGVPRRHVIDKTGPSVGVQCLYPIDFDVAMSGLIPGKYEISWHQANEDGDLQFLLRDGIEVERHGTDLRAGERADAARAGVTRVISDMKFNRQQIQTALQSGAWPANPSSHVFSVQHWQEVHEDIARGGPGFDVAYELSNDAFLVLDRSNKAARAAHSSDPRLDADDRSNLEEALKAVDSAEVALAEARDRA